MDAINIQKVAIPQADNGFLFAAMDIDGGQDQSTNHSHIVMMIIITQKIWNYLGRYVRKDEQKTNHRTSTKGH